MAGPEDALQPPSLWAAMAPPAPHLPRLEGERTADVAIVGAGFTGLSAALHLLETGADVAVVEAKDVGSGASGRNNGQVIPTLSRADPDDMIAAFGPDPGERFVALVRDSAQLLFDLVRRHGIDCDAEQTGWVQPAHSPGRIRVSERRCKAWADRGAPVELLDRDAISRLLGSEAYYGGWLNRTGGHVNPLALARGLARVVQARGGTVFVRSPATEMSRETSGWRVSTAAGTLRSRALVIATNAYTVGVLPDLRRSVVPMTSWQMATTPLSAEVRASVIPGRQAVSDTRGDLRFFRYTRDGRLVTGGALMLPVNGPERLKRLVGRRLRETFPQIGEVGFDYVWNGIIGMTADKLPHVHRLGADGYAWTGCNGRGVALAISLGRELARAVLGEDARNLALPFSPLKPQPFYEIARRVAPFMLGAYRWRDAREIALIAQAGDPS
ncbi:MAG: FAD-binding oxidoreductase [Pseudomonadota bacterium]|nr:FAD-binding oxidoreductase [Pseudomonadota bacterium]